MANTNPCCPLCGTQTKRGSSAFICRNGHAVNADMLLRLAENAERKPRPMTLAQAREKAREKWGKEPRFIKAACIKRDGVCRVGYWKRWGGVMIKTYFGDGPTFEAAFADADKREAEAKASKDNG